MRNIFLLVKDNLNSPPLALLSPMVSRMGKENILEIAYKGQLKVGALEEKSEE